MKNSVDELSRAFLRERLKDPEYRKYYEQEQLINAMGSAVKSVRKQKRLTQGELAKRAGVPESAVERMERGEYKRWTVKLLQQLAAATNSRVKIEFVPLDDK
jgi:DNA-binding XRE family transcriptional regulator